MGGSLRAVGEQVGALVCRPSWEEEELHLQHSCFLPGEVRPRSSGLWVASWVPHPEGGEPPHLSSPGPGQVCVEHRVSRVCWPQGPLTTSEGRSGRGPPAQALGGRPGPRSCTCWAGSTTAPVALWSHDPPSDPSSSPQFSGRHGPGDSCDECSDSSAGPPAPSGPRSPQAGAAPSRGQRLALWPHLLYPAAPSTAPARPPGLHLVTAFPLATALLPLAGSFRPAHLRLSFSLRLFPIHTVVTRLPFWGYRAALPS